ncbi:MAG: SDR family oxidoreductase [Deltaproteobacteria bacterium]|nr:SDR family oxidoreductase [Deltaproteobacteria bacterium]
MLKGKRVLITGGSGALGRALCLRAAQEGASVAFTYHSNQDRAAQTRRQIEGAARKALTFQVSALEKAALEKVAREIDKAWGGIDVLINNAGINQPMPFSLMEEKDWDLVVDTNVKGLYLTTHAILPFMIRQRQGVILNVSSLAGLKLIENPVHYSTSKAAVKGFTESLAVEVARYNVRVNCLAPGLLDEGMADLAPDYKWSDYLKMVALGRRGTTAEVARCAVFLVSDRNSFMNGSTLHIDGGF